MPTRIALKPKTDSNDSGSEGERNPSTRCRHLTPKGRRCRLFQTSRFGYCRRHSAEVLAAESQEAKALAKELLGSAKNFKTAIALNETLGRALTLFAEKRLTSREVDTISRLSHQLILTQSRLYSEYCAVGDRETWAKMVQQNVPADSAPEGIVGFSSAGDRELGAAGDVRGTGEAARTHANRSLCSANPNEAEASAPLAGHPKIKSGLRFA